MADLISIYMEMMKNPPDPNEPVPAYNKHETMYGAVLPFFVISWIAVLTRLYTRFFTLRDAGWDDYNMIVAAFSNLASMIGFIGCIEDGGMGKHLLYLNLEEFETTMKWLYVASSCYALTTTFVKVSLLCQYLRMFQSGRIRTICYVLLVLVSIWGFAYCFLSFFPCIPVRGFWDRTLVTAKCFGVGFGSANSARSSFIIFAATNMAFDTIIFFLPMVEYIKMGLGRKQVMALIGLFTLGSVVVLMSILRVWTTIRRNQNSFASLDFTWWFSLTLIISAIELDFAIICASIPIFWPQLTVYLAQIFVTNEVHVTHHSRLDDDESNARGMDFEMDGGRSWKTNSEENLTRVASLGNGKTDYTNRSVVDRITGRAPERTDVRLDTSQNKNWRGYT